MANLNINRNVTDVFYRYKMPRLIAKVEGKGNGIKTVIVNMSDIAKALQRPATYPTKYFGCELGAQTQFDVKNDRYIVNGSHESVRLQDLLDGFIRKFVLCQECENPETNLTVLAKKQMIVQRCIACGHSANIDMRHKLTTYILKNPPESENTPGTTAEQPPTTTPGKKSKRSKGSKETENGNGDTNHHDRPATNDGGHHHESKKSSSVTKDAADDEDWCEDTSDAAVQARMEALSGAAKVMTISDDLEKSQQERIDMFYSFVKQKKAADCVVGADNEKEIVSEAERLDVKDKAPLILAELLYDQDMLTQIKRYRSLLVRFTAGNQKAQSYLLGGFEQLVGNVHPTVLLPKVLHILKAFYELDIVEEEVLIEWDKKASKKFVSKEMSKEIRAKAAPFIKWLQEAEEESSDEEDDGVEVVYTNAQSPGLVPATAAAKPTAAAGAGANHEDDLNIDDI
jgi:translation initiation factor 5